MQSDKQRRFTRRKALLAAAGLAGGAGGLGLYAWRIEPHWLELVRRDLPIRNLPTPLVGKLIVQLSDLHVGPVVDPEYLRAAFRQAGDCKPWLTVITGDFVTYREKGSIDAMTRLVAQLDPGPAGCISILGNHDYSQSWSDPRVADEISRRLQGLGHRVLRNESCAIEGLTIVGLDDFLGRNFHPEQVLPSVDWDRPTLTLCHNPDAVDDPRLSAVRGWVLSGHTHGGQCKPPLLPPPILPVRNRRYTSGQFAIGPDRWLYINRALGYLHRIRFNVRPEITVFRLVQAQ